jgi:hypothetical protein
MAGSKSNGYCRHAPTTIRSNFLSEVPRVIEQSLEGLTRVSKIVRAMRDFSHPAGDKKLRLSQHQQGM